MRLFWRAARPGRAEGGFLLLEALAAAVIAALVLAGLYRAAMSSRLAYEVSSGTEAALLVARSHLALARGLVGGVSRPPPQDARGTEGLYRWRLHIAPIATAEAAANLVEFARHADEARPTLYDVGVDVTWLSGEAERTVHLATELLGFQPPEVPPP